MFKKSLLSSILVFCSPFALADEFEIVATSENTVHSIQSNRHNKLDLQNSINLIYSRDFSYDSFSLSNNNSDWIRSDTNYQNSSYSIESLNNFSNGNQMTFAWNLTDLFSVNLNVFKNQYRNEINSAQIHYPYNKTNKNQATALDVIDINRNISGYKLGISSSLGLGNTYNLDINMDYGLLDGADLMGFNSGEITTTSFGLGIRNARFGASLNTDIYHEVDNNNPFLDYRLGLEFDWHFSDETTLSVGSKQRMNTDSINSQPNSLDNLTGNVQYIKFQHNL